MALMDDKSFLISHIRQSFITSDDTGMCEIVIEPNDTEKCDDSVEMDCELSHSPDVIPDMDFTSHRRRSNTAQRLEKLKREKHKQSQIKHIQWRNSELTKDELAEHFVKKIIEPRKIRESALSLQLEQSSNAPVNPFLDYARYDGKASGGLATKKFGIFLTMQDDDERNYPMEIECLLTAKIQDLIGLICWHYTNQGRNPLLKHNPENYTLHIAEDDGEVDLDFPALDSKEPVSKFGFGKLALVEKEIEKTSKSSVVVTIHMPNRGFSVIPLDTDDILMKDLLEQVLKRRRLNHTLQYRLEKQEEAGAVIDLDKSLAEITTRNFCLVRENSVRGDLEPVEVENSDMARSLSSHQYKSYNVIMKSNLTKAEVQLGISGEKIEIDPVQTKGLFLKQKASTCDTENVASCHIVDSNSKPGRLMFRLVYRTGTDFRHNDFECDDKKAEEIVEKINNIMEMRSSLAKKEYLVYKENKRLLNPFKKIKEHTG